MQISKAQQLRDYVIAQTEAYDFYKDLGNFDMLDLIAENISAAKHELRNL